MVISITSGRSCLGDTSGSVTPGYFKYYNFKTWSSRMAIHIAGQVLHLAATVLVLSLALFAYERSIEPLYGSVPTAYYLAHVLYGACTVAYFAPAPSPALSQFILGALLVAAPTTTYWVGLLTGRHVADPKWGPVATHLIVLAPIFFVGTSMHLNVSPSSLPKTTLQNWEVYTPLRQLPLSDEIICSCTLECVCFIRDDIKLAAHMSFYSRAWYRRVLLP